MANEQKREYFPGLEGIRGYAFIMVFLIHYTSVYDRPHQWIYYPYWLLMNTGWFLVPIFFVLSGFLITRILMSTREREGYFKVFYLRRSVRVFPLYYFTLAVSSAMVFLSIRGLVLHWQYLSYLVYLQNFWPVAVQFKFHPWDPITLTPLWSMAVEEQFYLLWPIAIWFLRTDRNILRFSYLVIAGSFLARLAWPLMHIPYDYAYFYTVSRGDAIMMGAVLAVQFKQKTHWNLLVRAARIAIPVIWGAAILVTLINGHSMTTNYLGVAGLIPAMNLLAYAFVVLAIHPSGLVQKVCSFASICWLGRMSYALYLFHWLYSHYFTGSLVWKLARHMPYGLADAITLSLAFLLTVGLAMLAYRFIELPGMRLKDKFPYGKRRSVPEPSGEHSGAVPEPAALASKGQLHEIGSAR